ncbi:hypothetical protein MLD52_00145 [Puniceicoccaceae bacterium K14]|nr:hypothetical protein [Puniceicoccaceae bacterium K14]
MEFPPVAHMVSATFNELHNRAPTQGTETLNAAQPSATASDTGTGENQSSSSSFEQNRSETVGQYLDEKA